MHWCSKLGTYMSPCHTHSNKCTWICAYAPMQRYRQFFSMETIPNSVESCVSIMQAVVCRTPSCCLLTRFDVCAIQYFCECNSNPFSHLHMWLDSWYVFNLAEALVKPLAAASFLNLAFPPPSYRDATTPSPCWAPHFMTQERLMFSNPTRASHASLPPRRCATTCHRHSPRPCTAPLSCCLQPLLILSL